MDVTLRFVDAEGDHGLGVVMSPGLAAAEIVEVATLLSERGRIDRPCTMGQRVRGLYPHVSGRWQEISVRVRVAAGGLSSRSEGAVLNGANVALVKTGAGGEMFLEATLVDV